MSNVLTELQRTSSVKALIGCHSHLVSKLQITDRSQVSCRFKPVQVWPKMKLMGRSCLRPKHTRTHTHIHTEVLLLSRFSPFYFVYLVCNETRKSHADFCRAVIVSEMASLWKESMQEITSQMRYFSYCLCSICPISGTIRLLTTCRHFRSLHAVLIVQSLPWIFPLKKLTA